MNDIQIGRLSGMLHKLLGITEGAPVPTLAPELIATIPLEVDRPEWAFLGGESLCYGGGAQGAVAGEMSHVQLLNRSPGVLAVLERVDINMTANGTVYYGHEDAVFPGGSVQVSSGFRDSRKARGTGVTACECWTQTDAGVLIDTVLGKHPVLGYGLLTLYPNIILTPSKGFAVACTTVNVSLYVTFYWRERMLEKSEVR